ncbi:hypothetical protein HMPREF1982_03923 [Clostridiales bacterium oral taxon 876 str. F0540]|nr:hypothetical protein HMPREF1982_03923 [Clostridiales bacterium oral taxon 876 str. F0540]
MGRGALYFRGMNRKQRREEYTTYRDKLTENIVQATARDCLAESLKSLETSGYQPYFHVHDEAYWMCLRIRLT